MASWGVRGTGSTRFSELVKSTAAEQQRAHERDQREGEGEGEGESEEEEEEEDDDELLTNASAYEEEEEESLHDREVLFEVQAMGTFVAEEDGDLSFKEREILRVLESSRDDGWLLAENALGERGVVPGNYVQQLHPIDEPSRTTSPVGNSATPRRGRDLWAKLRATVKQTSLADVLSALGAIPSGFRDSTLAKLLQESSTYLTSTWVFPRLSPTGMAFKDLRWNHTKEQLQPNSVKITRWFKIIAARMIPLPGKGIQVLSRHVRIAVFNKNNMLSNIHTVRALWNPQEEKSWKFAPKSQTADNSLYHRICVAKLDSSDPNIELLFELGITFKREKTDETGELSCGWASLPLFGHSGSPVPNRTFELKVHGGTPFESGVEVNPASNLRASGSFLPSLLRANRTPRLYVQLVNPTRTEKSAYSLIPSTIVTSSLYVKPIGCFRQLVGAAFLEGRLGLQLPNYVNKPALSVFCKAIDQPDLMDSTLTLWSERIKTARRGDKQSLRYSSEQLEAVLLQHTYPLLHSPTLPPPHWADEKKEKERLVFIAEFSKRPHLSGLLAAEIKQIALTTSEQIFSIYPYCERKSGRGRYMTSYLPLRMQLLEFLLP